MENKVFFNPSSDHIDCYDPDSNTFLYSVSRSYDVGQGDTPFVFGDKVYVYKYGDGSEYQGLYEIDTDVEIIE